ncbi:hypothetical protein [Sulfurovum sp. NBC37-1]|uniref:hypothetical protein n=1 Tax=Sulfurovum sp. (strain NBC37-1) TaxID=387093 RepID=UPI0001587B2D|nr:hypothetical protein [Sulfurovum sp. NBC37-1]BAF72782.1 hypothetical protein SUN_1835 [Sulfurovum sp. NBC37-1]
MQKLLDETEKKAYVFLKKFGFEEAKITPIVEKGKQNLETTLKDLEHLLSSEATYSDTKVDDVLHALKGLLGQMGNHKRSEEIEALRNHLERQKLVAWLEHA